MVLLPKVRTLSLAAICVFVITAVLNECGESSGSEEQEASDVSAFSSSVRRLLLGAEEHGIQIKKSGFRMCQLHPRNCLTKYRRNFPMLSKPTRFDDVRLVPRANLNAGNDVIIPEPEVVDSSKRMTDHREERTHDRYDVIV